MKEIDYSTYFWQNELVRLRARRSEDWETHYLNCFDSKGRRLLQYRVELPPNIETHRAMCDKAFEPDNGLLVFSIETLDGQLVGGLHINSIDERNGTFDICIQISRESRGKGYGAAAMRIALRYAFFERRLNKFHCDVLEGNIGSATMMRKLGCVEEGRQREMVYMDGRYHDIILFGLTRRDFEKQQETI